jgi:5'-phosphate synthase pdxT subunit
MSIGVLGVQGDFREHLLMLERIGCDVRDVRTAEAILEVDGLIIPGGESTTLSKLMTKFGLVDALLQRAHSGMPIYGTCAGAILVAKEVAGGFPKGLDLIDISIDRNAYGSQKNSFESDIEIEGVGSYTGIFIRAPIITRCGTHVKILAEHEDSPVLVRQENILVGTFHPELTSDGRIHEYFVQMIKQPSHSQ